MKDRSQNRFVCLVSDRRERAERLAHGIDLVLPCRVIEPNAPLPAGQPVAFVIDIAADRAETDGGIWIERLAGLIRARAIPCLYLARGNTAQDAAASRLFGAPVVIDPHGSAGIVPTLRRLVEATQGAPPSREAGPSERSPGAPATAPQARVGAATRLVTRLFDNAAAGRPPSVEEVEAGTTIVLDTVSEIGIRAWLDLVWRHDIQVYQHSLSVAGFAAAFAGQLGFSYADRRRLARAALLHDVGKALIPLAILNKPGALTPDEMRIMRAHAALGADLLAREAAFGPEILDVVRYHHERLDGSGYPEGLTAARIGDLVRLVAICDVHSALTERRVYRAPMTHAEAFAVMEAQAGQLDPDLLRAYRPVVARAAGVESGQPARQIDPC
jgi:putative nucleotidyltransferase with HDIG domain